MGASATTLVLNRNFTLTTTLGHSIQFVKDQPTHVPPAMYRAALEIGAQPVAGAAPQVEDETPSAPVLDPSERNDKIGEAIELLVDRNEREDFTAAGAPTVSAVSSLVGFKVSGAEVTAAWQLYHEKKEAAE